MSFTFQSVTFQSVALQPVVVGLVLMMTPVLTACGESKAVQCNKLIQVINQASTDLSNINQNKEVDIRERLTAIADRIDDFANNLETLAIQDETLKGFRQEFIALYKQTSINSREIVNKLAEKETKAANKALETMKTESQKESDLVQRLNTYCQGS